MEVHGGRYLSVLFHGTFLIGYNVVAAGVGGRSAAIIANIHCAALCKSVCYIHTVYRPTHTGTENGAAAKRGRGRAVQPG